MKAVFVLRGLLCGALLVGLLALPARAAEIALSASVALTEVLKELVPQFESASGNKVTVHLGTAAALKKEIDGGAAFDVAILTPPLVEDLVKQGKAAAGSTKLVARAGLGIMVRKGAPAPNVGSEDSFKQALRAAKSIGITDPALGGASGVYMAALIERLGLAQELKPKMKLADGARGLDQAVARGEAEIGITQISEILPEPGVTLVGPVPGTLQNFTSFSAGIATAARNMDAAKALVAFLTSPAAQPVIKSKGMEP